MMPRAFVGESGKVGETVVLQGEAGHHFARVLRVKVSEPVALVMSTGSFLAEVVDVDGKGGAVRVRLVESLPSHEPVHQVYLVQGLAKGDKIDTVIQKTTEVGITGIVLVQSKRSVVRFEPSKAASKLERFTRIAEEAASQSQRDRVPEILFCENFPALEKWLTMVQADRVLLLDEDERMVSIKEALRDAGPASTGTTIIAVGPEGGWDDSERVLWRSELNATTVTLGPRILRTETAGLVACAAILYQFGDLGG